MNALQALDTCADKAPAWTLAQLNSLQLKIAFYVSAGGHSTFEVHQTHVNMLQGVDTCADRASAWTLAFLVEHHLGCYLGSALAFLNPTQLELFDPPGHIIGPVDLLPKEPYWTPLWLMLDIPIPATTNPHTENPICFLCINIPIGIVCLMSQQWDYQQYFVSSHHHNLYGP